MARARANATGPMLSRERSCRGGLSSAAILGPASAREDTRPYKVITLSSAAMLGPRLRVGTRAPTPLCLRVRTRASTPLRLGVRTRASTPLRLGVRTRCLYMLRAVDINDLARIRPIFRAVHQARANWIFADVFPFLCVTFIIAQ